LPGQAAVSVFKVLSCTSLLGAIIWFALDLAVAHGLLVQGTIYWVVLGVSAVIGGYLARFTSWGWLVGGMVGLLAGLSMPLTLAFVFPETGYEKALPWLLLSAGAGCLLGGYHLDKYFKSRLRC
jgi:hypothetical protein